MTNILTHYFDLVVQFNRMERYIESEYLLTLEEFRILLELYCESRTWTYLRYELNMTTRILNATLDMLRSKGLITVDTKRAHSRSNLAHYLIVSEKGEALLQTMYERELFSPFVKNTTSESVAVV